MIDGGGVFAWPHRYGVPVAVTGTVTAVNDDATAIGFDDDGGRSEGVDMAVATHAWMDVDGGGTAATRPRRACNPAHAGSG